MVKKKWLSKAICCGLLAASIGLTVFSSGEAASLKGKEVQLTESPNGHELLNKNVFSPDSKWIVYDVRSQDYIFDGDRIEKVNVENKDVVLLYKSPNNSKVGAASYHPFENKVAFIHGPEFPTDDYQYSFIHRYGAIVDEKTPMKSIQLDARDVTAPFTPGALRGGTHVHIWHPDGSMMSYTYEDEVLVGVKAETPDQDMNIRNIGVTTFDKKVKVHPGERNADGYFSVLVTRTNANAKSGSDEIVKAVEEGWIGKDGYVKKDGSHQKKALAFQGIVLDKDGKQVPEVYRVDLPADLTVAGESGPLEGSLTQRPQPPKGTVQTRLTYTTDKKYPGIQGPRHWLRTNADGSLIAYMAKDDQGIVQIWTVPTIGGATKQITHNTFSVQTCFSWSPSGDYIAYAADNSLFVTKVSNGDTSRLTEKTTDSDAIMSYWLSYSPDGKKIAYLRNVKYGVNGEDRYPQIFCFEFEKIE